MLSRNSRCFLEPEISFLPLQQLVSVTCPYPEPDESIHTPSTTGFFKHVREYDVISRSIRCFFVFDLLSRLLEAIMIATCIQVGTGSKLGRDTG